MKLNLANSPIYEKKNQRIRKGEQETGGKIAPISIGGNRGGREGARRVATEKIQTVGYENA